MLQCPQTLDPFTDMHTYTDLYLAHPLETWTPFDIVVNSAYALLTMPVTYKPINVVNSPFIRYSGTSAYISTLEGIHKDISVVYKIFQRVRDIAFL